MYLLASILCLALGSALGDDIIEGDYNVNEICSTVKVGTSLGSIVSCGYYYVCTEDGPVKTTCSAGYSYNVKTASCGPSSTVSCFYNVPDPCIGKSGENFVPSGGSCNKWTYCSEGKAMHSGTCRVNEFFDGVSQSCKHGKCENLDATEGPKLRSLCEVVQPNIYFGSAKSCNSWNYCKNDGVLVSDNCETEVYVVSLGYCGTDTKECDRISNPIVPEVCVENEEDPLKNIVADAKVCGTYYKCEGTTNSKLNCPTGYFFDDIVKKCILRQQAQPIGTCDRCQYATVSFVNDVNNKDCNTYYHCNKGIKNGETTKCPKEFFFNEDLQGCTKSGIASYQQSHGACHVEPGTPLE